MTQNNYQAIVGDETVPPPPPPPPPPLTAPPPEAGGGGSETEPLIAPPPSNGEHEVFEDEAEVDAQAKEELEERENHKIRLVTKRLLPWIGLALIAFSIILVVCIVLRTSSHRRSKKGYLTSEYDVILKQYETAARHELTLNLNPNPDVDGGKVTSLDVSPGCEATAFLMRHCDKSGNLKDDAGDEHCGYVGYERADYLATLFGDDGRWPLPSYLYAMGPNRRNGVEKNFRQVETLLPLAKKAEISIRSDFLDGDDARLARIIYGKLRSGKLCGKVAVISWRHPEIPTLAQQLGCGPFDGCPMKYDDFEFDSVWEIKYVYAPLRPRVSEPGLETVANNTTNRADIEEEEEKEVDGGEHAVIKESKGGKEDKGEEQQEEEGGEEDLPGLYDASRHLKKGKKVKKAKVPKNKTAAKKAKKAKKNAAKKAKTMKGKNKGGAAATATAITAGAGAGAGAISAGAAFSSRSAVTGSISAGEGGVAVPSGQPRPNRPDVPLVWEVHGTVIRMGFDPLTFSMRAGDYPSGGTAEGGRWIEY